jgi:hypothetical protein
VRLSARENASKEVRSTRWLWGKKVYMLEGHRVELDKVAGVKAKVKGKISAETLTVQSVVPAMKMN